MDRIALLILKRLVRQFRSNLAAATSLADFKASMNADLLDMAQDFADLQTAMQDVANPSTLRDAMARIARK